MKNFLSKYRHAWTLLYVFIYIPWFVYLEQHVVTFTPIHVALDDLIPFNEYFIIPYLLWFFYVSGTLFYLLFTSKDEYYRLSAFLFIGMTICLMIYTLWPNGQNLRVDLGNRHNIFITLIKTIYKADTSTNVFPSIHVFNSIGIHIAICHSQVLKKKGWIKPASFILMVLICLSTVFLKQHSVLDGLGGILLSGVMYILVYKVDYSFLHKEKVVKEIDKQLV